MKNQIYIYLARKDKKGIKFITSFPYKSKCFPTKIDLNNLNKIILSKNIQEIITLEINQNKLMYDVYAESSTSTEELKKSLINRGYKNIPRQQITLRLNSNPHVNDDVLVTQNSTMLRRKSDQARRT